MSFATLEMKYVQEAAAAIGLGTVDSVRERMLRDIEKAQSILRHIKDVERLQKHAVAITATERAVRQIEEARAGIWQSLSRFHQRTMESLERIRREMEIVERVRRQVQILRTSGHPLRRNQEGASGSGRRSSAKKSTKSASNGDNGGGGSDGDGEGPPQKPSKRKKPLPKVSSSTCLTLPPGVPIGENAPQQPPSRQVPSPHRISPLVYLCMLGLIYLAQTTDNVFIRSLVIIITGVVVLCVTGHPDVAKQFLTSKTISVLIARLVSLIEGRK